MRGTFAATTFESVKFVLRENHSERDSRGAATCENFSRALSINAACALEPNAVSPVLDQKEREMRKAIAELDAEQREALLYLADLGTAVCASGLIVSLIRAFVDLV